MNDKILLAHGSGGRLMYNLIKELFLREFKNPILSRLDDGAVLKLPSGERLAYSTDSFVVDPVFFDGGDIGLLSVYGTVNDLSMCGAVPLYITVSIIMEEGFPFSDLRKISSSIKRAGKIAGVKIVSGDVKVVPRGKADRIFINTSGIGLIKKGVEISGSRARAGDVVILSGYIGDHEIAILSKRQNPGFRIRLRSDCQPLNHIVKRILETIRFAGSCPVHCLRDPTRGGLATILNEICISSKVGMEIEESAIPVRACVKSACDMLGFDPLYLANEGKFIAVVKEDYADKILAIMRSCREGRNAVIIGRVVSSHPGVVILKTRIGGKRILGMLEGEQLPRIC